MELNLNNEEAKVNEDYFLKGNLEAGIEGVVRKNDKLYNEVKSGTWSQTFKTNNIDYKIGALDGARYVQYTQHNTDQIKSTASNAGSFIK